ncbi:MAG: BACON domain-containing protein [Gemmatimonadota bacterium]
MVTAAACTSSSPTEVDSEAGKSSKYQVSPLSIDFGSNSTSVSITLTNSTKRPIAWTASENAGWLSLEATSGTLWGNSSRIFSVSAQRNGLSAGTHTTDVKFSASKGGGTEVVPVSVTVPSTGTTPGQLSVSPPQVDFGTSWTTASVTLTNTGESSLSWTASESAGWLSLNATSGSLAGESSKTLSLSAQRSGMTAGTYTTAVLVSAGTAGSATATVSMTVPPTSPPPPSVLLSGKLVDQFGGQGLSGISVQFAGQTATTDAAGSFTIAGEPVSTLGELTLSGSGVYLRETYAKTGDMEWQVVPSSFNMNAYNDVARDEWGTETIRWVSPPTVYVDTNPEGFEGGAELEQWISEVQSQAAAFVSKWTGSTISPAGVIVTSNPPNDFTGGTIVIHFSDENSDYGNNTSTIGYARVSWSSDRSISGAAVWLRYVRYPGTSGASKRTGILGHELGHAMGMGHMSGTTASFMTPSIGSNTDLSAFDSQAALLLYTRSPGNTSPDTDSSYAFSGSLSPARAPGMSEWVCQDEAEWP